MHMFIGHKHAYNWQMNTLGKINWTIFHGYITMSTLWGNLNLYCIIWNTSVIGSFARTRDESLTESSYLFYCIRSKYLFVQSPWAPDLFLPSVNYHSLLLTDSFTTDSIVLPPNIISTWFHLASSLFDTLKRNRNCGSPSSQRLHLEPSSIYIHKTIKEEWIRHCWEEELAARKEDKETRINWVLGVLFVWCCCFCPIKKPLWQPWMR